MNRFTMRCTFRSIGILALSFLVLSFAACKKDKNGSGSPTTNPPPSMNADGSLGVIAKYYYHHDFGDKVSVLSITEDKVVERLAFDPATGLKSLGTISFDKVTLNATNTAATVLEDPMVFEAQDIKPQNLSASGSSIPDTNLEVLCLSNPSNPSANIGSSSYKEIRIVRVDNGFQFVAVNGTETTTVNPNSLASYVFAGTTSVYNDLTSQTSMQINIAQHAPTDPAYFKTVINLSPLPGLGWGNTVYCHFNKIAQTNPMVSSTALSAVSPTNGSAAWTNPLGALASGNPKASALVGLFESTNPLQLTGYFADPYYRLPAGSTVDGIVVGCSLQSGDPEGVAVGSLKLMKAATPASQDRGGMEQLSRKSHLVNKGSATDLWGTSWAPQDLYDPGFGAEIVLTSILSAEDTGILDYCQIAVYWH